MAQGQGPSLHRCSLRGLASILAVLTSVYISLVVLQKKLLLLPPPLLLKDSAKQKRLAKVGWDDKVCVCLLVFSQPQSSDSSLKAVLASALLALVCPSTSCLPLCVHCHGQPRWKGQERCFPPSAAMGGRGTWCCRHCLPPQRTGVQKI